MYIETMRGTADHMALFNDLPPEEQARYKEHLAQDPVLAEAFEEWQALREEVRQSFNLLVPDRRVLTLYALAESGGTALLSEAEQRLLAEEREHIEAALRVSPAVGRIVQQIQHEQNDFAEVWHLHTTDTAEAADIAEAQPDPVPKAAAPKDQQSWRPVYSLWQGAGRWAAVLAVALLAGVFYWMARPDAQTETVVAKAGEIRVLELSDGTRIRLMENSSLTYTTPGAGETFDRYVRLSGKALFDVQTADAPFVVETTTSRTTVLGTTFGLETDPTGTAVVLVEGQVQFSGVSPSAQQVLLKPGQMSRVALSGAPSAPVAVAVADALKWTRLFVFRGTPVSEVVAQLSAHYNTPIQVDAVLADEQFHGTYEQNWTLAYILKTLAEGLDATYTGSMAEGYVLQPAE